MSIRVALVEDDRRVRENLAMLIDAAPGYVCVGQCATAEEAIRILPQVRPEVILMDINLPGDNGIDCVRNLSPLIPNIHIIMLTVEEDGERVLNSLKAGATGYLVKHASTDEILEAISEVHRGGAPMSSHIARMVVTTFRQSSAKSPPDQCLSQREEEVLRLLGRGYRSKEIADLLGIGVGTVNTYVRHIYEKLHVRSRAEAVARHLRS